MNFNSNSTALVWSEWILEKAHNRWYQWAIDANGRYIYNYRYFGQGQGANPYDQSQYGEYTQNQTGYTTGSSTMGNGMEGIDNALGGLNIQDDHNPSLGQQSIMDKIIDGSEHLGLRDLYKNDMINRKQMKKWKVQEAKDQRKVFKQGRVFMTHEYLVAGRQLGEAFTEVEAKNLEQHVERRRYIVLKKNKLESVCISIHTYRQQGTMARSVNASVHVQAYSEKDPPSLLCGERLSSPPVHVRLDDAVEEHLHPASRINCGKLTTIQHNIPILPIGQISTKDLDRLKTYVYSYLTFRQDKDDEAEEEEEEEEEDDDDDEEEEEEGDNEHAGESFEIETGTDHGSSSYDPPGDVGPRQDRRRGYYDR